MHTNSMGSGGIADCEWPGWAGNAKFLTLSLVRWFNQILTLRRKEIKPMTSMSGKVGYR